MQFQVPQFIETEDKIVGPFTIRQFIYVVIAGVFCFFFYFKVATWLFVILSIIFLGSAFALGSIKISGRGLPHVLRAAFNFYWKPQLYLWQPEHKAVEKYKTPAPTAPPARVKLPKPAAGKSLRNAWQKLQTGSASTARKISNKQFFMKTQERYEIFQKLTGDRQGARRIDYR